MRPPLLRAPKSGHRAVDPARCKVLVDTLERDPSAVPAYFMYLESAIKWLMDEIFALAKSGEDDDEKMKLVALEYRARLVLERYRKMNSN